MGFVHCGTELSRFIDNLGWAKKISKNFDPSGTASQIAHFYIITAETPLPSKRPVIRSRRPPSSQTEAFFSDHVFSENDVLAIDLAIDRVGNGNHSLIVVENPADFASL